MHENHGDATSTGRVLSVSPDDARDAASAAEPRPAPEVFVTPRVLDQTAFNELAGSLRTLIDEATRVSARLATTIQDAASPTPAQEQLRDTLHLGARMLKALQGQLERADELTALMATREASLRSMPDAVRAEATTALEETYTRLDEAVEATRRRGEEALEHATAGLDPVEERIAELTHRAESLANTLESAEVTAAALARRVRRLEEG